MEVTLEKCKSAFRNQSFRAESRGQRQTTQNAVYSINKLLIELEGLI